MPHPTHLRRALGALIALAMLLTLAVAPVAAGGNHGGNHGGKSSRDVPTRIDLPNGFQPEGIESWSKYLYAGSLVDGAIYRANAKNGNGRVLIEGTEGQAAAGLHIDRKTRLWVAGASGQQIRVYGARSGRLMATYEFPTAGFINDLDIVGNTVYATDSANAQLLVIPLRGNGWLPDPSVATTLPLTGDYVHADGFNLNGIAAYKGKLIAVQSNTGLLFRIHPRTGETTLIDTDGALLPNGDGLEVSGRTLYVVQNQLNQVAKLKLSKSGRSADLSSRVYTSDELDVPTTVTKAKTGLYVVNARFGTDPTADTEYWITRLSKRTQPAS